MRLWFSVLMSWCLCAAACAEDPVYFADPNLKTVVEGRLCVWDPTPADMLGLMSLLAARAGVTDLTGLEYATNLQRLILRDNQISDLTPLSGLTNLEELWINVNQISDLSSLSGLSNLRKLLLHDNWISDLSPLADLADLEFLDFRYNQVGDVSALSGLTCLHYVDAFNNRIIDVSPLLGLTSLDELELRLNPLDEQAYCSCLQTIVDNNPGIDLRYSSNHVPPAGVTVSRGAFSDCVRLGWNSVCNGPNYAGRYYQASRALSVDGPRDAISEWQTVLGFDDVTAEPGTIYTYWVRTAESISGSDRGDYSEPDVGWVPGQPALTISSGPGGVVTAPGEGVRAAEVGQAIEIHAEPVDANLYYSTGWSGSAIEAGWVADANAAHTTVTVDTAHGTLKANFLSSMDAIYVDDDAPNDPGPNTAAASDPQESGTSEHPFDTIQEGIDVALDGATVIVRGGTYRECIEFLGRSITVTSLDPDERPMPRPYPVIDANYAGTAVTFDRGEDSNCVLAGFVITRGEGGRTGGVRCEGSSPTVAHCLIVGNQGSNPYRAAIYCTGSDATFTNCTVADNVAGGWGTGIYLSDSSVTLVNSIVWCSAPKDGIAKPHWGVGSEPSSAYSDMAGGGSGPGNMDVDPLFVRPGWWTDPNDLNVAVEPDAAGEIWVAGDYHLKSQAGRWDPEAHAWVQDDATSPCVDAGDPASPVGDEPAPNGSRVNLGAYGGTPHASKSDE